MTYLACTMPAYASDGAESPGVGLAAQLFCETFTLMSGTLGLLLGFAVALYGLWKIIGSSSLKDGVVFIIVGAMLTALPSVIRTSMGGLSEFLVQVGITNTSIVDAMNYALQFQGQCEQVPVDWTFYDDESANYFKSGGVGADGKPLPSPRERGVTASKGFSKGRATRGGFDTSDTQAMQGQKKAGCTHLVATGAATSGYGKRNSPCSGCSQFHPAVDIASSEGKGRCQGKEVYAAAGGKVTKSEYTSGYGNRIEVDVGGGRLNTYSHLSSRKAQLGQSVSAKDVIGWCGATGLGTGAHLHFEVIEGGIKKDPVAAGCK